MRLRVENLRFSYRKEKPVLNDISFSVGKGEFLSVLGPNGAGKSTLFRCILRILTSYEGEIWLDETDSRSLAERELASRIAYIPQIHRQTFGYSVLDTVLMGTVRQLSPFSMPKKEQRELAMTMLERLGIDWLAERNFAYLSGGEQQLVLVARAMAQQADILIMDEPTSALDYGNQLRVLQEVKKLSAEGYTVLLSTHNPQHAMSFADTILALNYGRVAACGLAKEVLTSELVRELYDVEVKFADIDSDRVMLPRMVYHGDRSGHCAEGEMADV